MAKLDKYRLGMADTWTFKTDGSVQVGDAVTFVAEATVGRGDPDDDFIGKVVQIDERGLATVQMHGMMVVTQDGSISAGNVGFATIAVDGNGHVKNSTGGRKVMLVEHDSTTNEIAVYLT